MKTKCKRRAAPMLFFARLLWDGRLWHEEVRRVFNTGSSPEAEDGPPGGGDPLGLGLGTELLTDFETIMHSLHEKRMALHQEAREAQRPAMEALREETRTRLSGVLTPEQQERFEAIMAFHRPPRPKGRDGEMLPEGREGKSAGERDR